ncbi:MAG: hypothetical protein Q4F24_08085 [Eubacteriales bacterium]|nr:hypothetical protein [Eubacteriales bacterium]
MEKLVATHYILHLSKQYEPGDELPASDESMVNAWISAGTAMWQTEEISSGDRRKAFAQTAEPGLPAADSESEPGGKLIGKVR